jgi:hypothetical protein
MRRARLLAATLGLCAVLPAMAQAASTVTLHTAFIPERLGSPTTVSFGFRITVAGMVPPPLSEVEVAYPANLGFVTSGLGLAACSPIALEEIGPAACPPDSRMGYGSAIVEIPQGSEPVREAVRLALFAGPSPDGYLHLLICATGEHPVSGQVVMSGLLLPKGLHIAIPLIPSVPEGPYVVVTQMQLTLGGNLTYYERVHGRSVAYHPAGVGLPRTCPRGGFAFAAKFAFMDGSGSSARTSVPCPRRR